MSKKTPYLDEHSPSSPTPDVMTSSGKQPATETNTVAMATYSARLRLRITLREAGFDPRASIISAANATTSQAEMTRHVSRPNVPNLHRQLLPLCHSWAVVRPVVRRATASRLAQTRTTLSASASQKMKTPLDRVLSASRVTTRSERQFPARPMARSVSER